MVRGRGRGGANPIRVLQQRGVRVQEVQAGVPQPVQEGGLQPVQEGGPQPVQEGGPHAQPRQADLQPVVQVDRLDIGQLDPVVRPRLCPTRGRGYRGNRGGRAPILYRPSEGSSGEEELEDPKLAALEALCRSLQDKLQSQEDNFREKIETQEHKFEKAIDKVSKEASDHFSEENSILQYKLNQNINTHLSKLE